jgi:hypothetical protein
MKLLSLWDYYVKNFNVKSVGNTFISVTFSAENRTQNQANENEV